MDRTLRREISRRIMERKRALEDDEATRAHIEALAEVFQVDASEVEAIVAEVKARANPMSGIAETLRRYQVLIGLVVAAVIVAGAVLALSPSREQIAASGESVSVAPNVRPYVQASKVASILSSITPVRMMVMEFQMQEGVYPSSLDDIGLDREEMRGQYIDDLTLDPDGTIFVRADESLGSNVYLVLSPRETMGGLNTEWHCVVNVRLKTLFACEYGDLSDVASRF